MYWKIYDESVSQLLLKDNFSLNNNPVLWTPAVDGKQKKKRSALKK